MPPLPLHVIHDYVDPGSYLASRLLDDWAGALPEPPEVTWTPLELRTPGSGPMDPSDPGWEAMVRFIQGEARNAGIPFTPPDLVPLTRKAHELALHGAEKGCFDLVHGAIFRAHFEEGRDIGRVDVLVELATDAGMDGAEARTVLGVDRFLPAVEEARRSLLARRVRGVPTVEAPDRVLEGFPDVAGFRRFLEELTSPSPPGDP
jgi:predicted DsbA family dithiol-disulfide isomerase